MLRNRDRGVEQMKTTVLEVDELVIYTRDVIMRFVEKRDVLLKHIEKILTNLSKKQCSCIRRSKDEENFILVESDKIMHMLIKLDIDSIFRSLNNFQERYNEIYYREVHPDVMKQEMIKFLFDTSEEISRYDKQMGELYADISSYNNNLKDTFFATKELVEIINNLMDTIEICKHQYHESTKQLKEAISYFNVPTECPPQL